MDITGVMNGPILCETRRVASAMQTDEKKDHRRRVNKPSDNMEQTESAPSVGEDA